MLLACLLTLPATVSRAAERVALVLGNGAYRNAPQLANAPADARGLAEVLGRLGFEVFSGIDLDRAATDALIHKFRSRAGRRQGGAVLLFRPWTASRGR